MTQCRKLVLNLAGGLQQKCRQKRIKKGESKRGIKEIKLTVVKVPIGGGKPGTDMVVRGVTLYVGSLCGDPARW